MMNHSKRHNHQRDPDRFTSTSYRNYAFFRWNYSTHLTLLDGRRNAHRMPDRSDWPIKLANTLLTLSCVVLVVYAAITLL